jgi:hypothetical protein
VSAILTSETVERLGGGFAQVIGPLPVAWDTAGLTDGDNPPYGAIVGPALPAGTLLLDAGIHITSTFDGTGMDPTEAAILAGNATASSTAGQFNYAIADMVASNALLRTSPTDTTVRGGVIPDDEEEYRLIVWFGLTAPSQGEADIYALIQVP